MRTRRPRLGRRTGLVLAVMAVLGTTACSEATTPSPSSEGKSSASAGGAEKAFGTPDPAKGKPLVFGMLAQEAGPVTFPEVSAAAKAAATYLNKYKGGIGGRPIELAICVTDGQPSTSERCANQILDKKPLAIIGATDTGSSASIPVWERANLAYLGGLPLTPAENASKQSVQFYQASIGDTAASAAYAAERLKAKSAAIIYTDDPQGQALGKEVILPTLKKAGVSKVKTIAVPPSAADLSAPAATAVSSNPDAIFAVVPNACANTMLALQAVGNKAKVLTIGPCFDPRVIKAAGTSMVGVLHASPFLDRTPASKDGALFFGALEAFAPKGTPPTPLAVGGFGSVINIEAQLDDLPPADLNTKTILSAFRTGKNHPNFMAHPYTCDGKQLGPFVAACNPYEIIYEVDEKGEEKAVSKEWFSPAEYFG